MKKILFFLIAMNISLFAYTDIDKKEMINMVKSGMLLIDIRTEPEWIHTGIYPHSKTLTFFKQNGNIHIHSFISKLRAMMKSENDPFILICNSGNRSSVAAKILEEAGFKNVYNKIDGILDLQKELEPYSQVAF